MQEVSKMRAMITRYGEFKGIYTVDMFYQGKIPYAVFEWAEDSTAENLKPLYKVRLDPRALTEVPAPTPQLKYQYRLSIEDLRPEN